MPAALPGSTKAQNAANPALGQFVIFDPLSGPKGSPLDKDASGNASTGALSTGIGYGANNVINIGPSTVPASAPQAIDAAGFTDDYIPGTRNQPTINTVNSVWMYAGGGRMIVNPLAATEPGRPFTPNPYTAGISICGAGNGGSRDAGAGPVFTGFTTKMVTAAGAVANGAAIETGWVNRSGKAMVTGDSSFGSNIAALAAPS